MTGFQLNIKSISWFFNMGFKSTLAKPILLDLLCVCVCVCECFPLHESNCLWFSHRWADVYMQHTVIWKFDIKYWLEWVGWVLDCKLVCQQTKTRYLVTVSPSDLWPRRPRSVVFSQLWTPPLPVWLWPAEIIKSSEPQHGSATRSKGLCFLLLCMTDTERGSSQTSRPGRGWWD